MFAFVVFFSFNFCKATTSHAFSIYTCFLWLQIYTHIVSYAYRWWKICTENVQNFYAKMSDCIADIACKKLFVQVVNRSSHLVVFCFCRKTVLKMFGKFTGKQPWWRPLLAKSCFDRTPPDGCFYVKEVITLVNL